MSSMFRSSDYTPASRVLNFTKRSLRKLSHMPCAFHTSEVAVLNVDQNNLSTLSGVEKYPRLIQLSACENSLVKVEAVQGLRHLVTLNLQGNSIMELVGLHNLPHLQWANLARNGIRSMDGLSSCVKLGHLDLSENCITDFSNVSSLSRLKTLLLHGNVISQFQRVPECLPQSLQTLSLSENEVCDLNQVCFLQHLSKLEQLSLLSNPCVSITESNVFDYRPYVLYWCSHLTMLDGMETTSSERMTSMSLFLEDKPYPFIVGEHQQLVQYLVSVHPLKDFRPAAPHRTGSGLPRSVPEQQSGYSTLEKAPPVSLSGKVEVGGETRLKEHPSLGELQELLAKSSGSSQSSLADKLRALEMVEQLIVEQERAVMESSEEDYGMKVLPISPLLSSNKQQTKTVAASSLGVNGPQVTVERKRSPSRHPQINLGDRSQRNQAWNALSRDLKHDTDSSRAGPLKATLSLPSKVLAPPVDQKQQEEDYQRLVDKLSKRHSNVPRKESKIAARFDSTVTVTGEGGGGGPSHMPEALVERDALGKEVAPSSGIGGNVLEEHQVKSLPSSYHTIKLQPGAETQSLSPFVTVSCRTVTPDSSFDPASQSTSTLSPVALNSSKLIQKLEGSTQTEESNMLDFTKAMDNQTGELDVNSLLSSLDQAYGFSTLVEKSKLLSSLMGSTNVAKPVGGDLGVASQNGSVREKRCLADLFDNSSSVGSVDYNKNATCIQVWYKGCVFRRKFQSMMRQTRAAIRIQAQWRGYTARRRDPMARLVKAELSRIKLEACAQQFHEQMNKCRQDLSDQTLLLRMQGDSIKMLLEEVRLVQGWCLAREKLEKRKAAVVIQKHWRGYIARKRNPDCVRLLALPSATCKNFRWIQAQLNRLHTALAPLQDMNGRPPKTQPNPVIDDATVLPCARDVVLTRHSDSCVLLKWTPPTDTPPNLNLQRLGYRIYVDGIPEGMVKVIFGSVLLSLGGSGISSMHPRPLLAALMRDMTSGSQAWQASKDVQLACMALLECCSLDLVGPNKLKAYIEGLDHSPIYRFTVRVVYSLGESVDSNCIMASLASGVSGQDKSQPHSPQIATPTKASPHHSRSVPHSPVSGKEELAGKEITSASAFLARDRLPAKHCNLSLECQLHSSGGAPHTQLSGSLHDTAERSIPSQLDGLPELLPSSPEGISSDNYMHKVSHIHLDGDQVSEEATSLVMKGDQVGTGNAGMVTTSGKDGTCLFVPLEHKGLGAVASSGPPGSSVYHSNLSYSADFGVSGIAKELPKACGGLLEHFPNKQTGEVVTSAVQLPGACGPSLALQNSEGTTLLLPTFSQDCQFTSSTVTNMSFVSAGFSSSKDTWCTQELMTPAVSGLLHDGFTFGKTKQMTAFDLGGYTLAVDNVPEQKPQAYDVPLLTKDVGCQPQVLGMLPARGNAVVPEGARGDSPGDPASETREVADYEEERPPKGAPEAAVVATEASAVPIEAGCIRSPVPTPVSPTAGCLYKQVAEGGGNSSANLSVCELEGCKLTSTSRTSTLKCFDADQVGQELPRMDSDSIRPLEQSTKTMAPDGAPDGRLSPGLLKETTELARTLDEALEDPSTLGSC